MISGLRNATKELVFYTDGDGQYDPTELLELLPKIEDCDVVQGYKIVRSDEWYRTIIGRVYQCVAKLAFGLSIRKTPKPGFKLLGAIVEAPGGNVFFKLTGPAKTVEAARADLMKMLKALTK